MKKKSFITLTAIACVVIITVVFNSRAAQSNDSPKDAATCASTCKDEKTKAYTAEEKEESAREEDTHDHDSHAAPSCGGHGHGDGEGLSDLDRPVDELWAAHCEHDILHFTCDECRYELGVVKLSDTVIQSKDKPGIVSVTQAVPMNFSKPLLLNGEVRLNETKTVRVSSPLQGTIKSLSADIAGHFTEGEVLLALDSDAVAEAKAEYMKKSAALTLAKKTAEREASLFAKKISAEVDVQEAQNRLGEAEIELINAGIRLERLGFSKQDIGLLAGQAAIAINGILPVHAPITGTVIEKYVSAGERIEAGKELLLLSDLSEVWVWANIREAELPFLQKQHADIACEIETTGTDGQKYPGVLDVVSGQMNAQTRTIKARIRVANTDGLLKPGMFVNIRVLFQGTGNVIAVPQISVLEDAGRSFVFVHKEGDYWVRRPVTPGTPFNEFVEIKEGLAIGQTIIADGSFLLKSDVLRGKMGAGCAD
ncbi:MAG: efflux RND transporter periplasmic adaptor subunit [Desulfobacteraceae bacterium]|nr:MAG: efflux RND transporter periplasmic adaptor subunit [Desulfobacteraceae bacterium]